MRRFVLKALLIPALFSFSCDNVASHAQTAPGSPDVPIRLDRRYQPGEVLRYEMKGSNQGWEYQVESRDETKQDAAGLFFEEISWSNLQSNAPMTLSPASLAFRQRLSLEPSGKYMTVPDLSAVQPFLIGPITDLLTFYSDLLIAQHQQLTKVGQHAYFEHGKPNSWADGQHVIFGQDAIDFDMTLTAQNAGEHTASVVIRHVPPKRSLLQMPASWMTGSGSEPANNWAEVERSGDRYTARAGVETFEVHMVVDTRDGKILSVEMQNPVTGTTRGCEDAALRKCSLPAPLSIKREVSLRLLP